MIFIIYTEKKVILFSLLSEITALLNVNKQKKSFFKPVPCDGTFLTDSIFSKGSNPTNMYNPLYKGQFDRA